MYKKHLLAAVVATIVLTVLIMAPKRVRIPYPDTKEHRLARKNSSKRKRHEACGKCHFEGGEYPIPDTHIKRERCYGCHYPISVEKWDQLKQEALATTKPLNKAATAETGEDKAPESNSPNPAGH